MNIRTIFALLFCNSLLGSISEASDWTHWRGPMQNGASPETGLISTWSLEGENLIWHREFIGRSTPIIVNGRVYVIGRTGKDITEQEHIACFDAETGDLIWEKKFNVWHSTITFNRLGWSSLGADGETGNIYAHLVSGLLLCFDTDGYVQWQRSLTEEFNRFSGYGGRLHTPVVDGDLVIISMGNRGWAGAPPSHRYVAFNKHTGETAWMARPGGGGQVDLTVYSTPVVTTIDGQRVLIAGNGNGGIFAFKVATGEKVWGFPFSKRGINTSPVVADNRVYVAHSEENVDNTSLGRVACLDARTGKEIWRQDGMTAGYASPAVHAGRVYVIDNSANVHCLDARTGKQYWEQNSALWARDRRHGPMANSMLLKSMAASRFSKRTIWMRKCSTKRKSLCPKVGMPRSTGLSQLRIAASILRPKPGCFAWAIKTRDLKSHLLLIQSTKARLRVPNPHLFFRFRLRRPYNRARYCPCGQRLMTKRGA